MIVSDSARFPEHGLYTGIAETEYRSLDRLNASLLGLLDRSPSHARYVLDNPPGSTPAQTFGQAVHMAVLEPDRFAGGVIATEHSSRTNAYKALVAENPDRIILSTDDHDACLRVADSARVALDRLGLSAATVREATVLFGIAATENESGDTPTVACKSRIDLYDPATETLVDLKTTSDASYAAFQRSFYNYGYHRQMAFYREALADVECRTRRVVIAAVEKEPPFAAACYEVDTFALERGYQDVLRLVDRYHACLTAGVWPGYTAEITPLALPRWAYA